MVSYFTLRRLALITIIALAALVGACGQKGPLKLPAPTQNEPTQQPGSSPAQ